VVEELATVPTLTVAACNKAGTASAAPMISANLCFILLFPCFGWFF